jgi:hypothetical protein
VNGRYLEQRYHRYSDGSLVKLQWIPRVKMEYQIARPVFVRLVGAASSSAPRRRFFCCGVSAGSADPRRGCAGPPAASRTAPGCRGADAASPRPSSMWRSRFEPSSPSLSFRWKNDGGSPVAASNSSRIAKARLRLRDVVARRVQVAGVEAVARARPQFRRMCDRIAPTSAAVRPSVRPAPAVFSTSSRVGPSCAPAPASSPSPRAPRQRPDRRHSPSPGGSRRRPRPASSTAPSPSRDPPPPAPTCPAPPSRSSARTPRAPPRAPRGCPSPPARL